MLKLKKHELHFFTGFNLDGFDAVRKKDSPINKSAGINVLNINPGFEYRFFYGQNEMTFLGLRLRYNIVDYMKSKYAGTDISGHTISSEIVIGIAGRHEKNRGLRAMRYYQ